jgi:hypothetical protein
MRSRTLSLRADLRGFPYLMATRLTDSWSLNHPVTGGSHGIGFRTDLTRGQVLARLGRFEEAREALERAHREGGRWLDGQLVGPLYAALVEVAAWQGDSTAAEAWAGEGAERMLSSEDAPFAVPVFAAAVLAEVNARLLSPGRDLTGALRTIDEWLASSAEALARTPAFTSPLPTTPPRAANASASPARTTRRDGPEPSSGGTPSATRVARRTPGSATPRPCCARDPAAGPRKRHCARPGRRPRQWGRSTWSASPRHWPNAEG